MTTPDGRRARKPSRCYSVAEVARMLGTPPGMLHRAIRVGEFPAVRAGGRMIVPAKAIVALAETIACLTSHAADWAGQR